MPTMSKSEFARLMGVNRSQPSRWCQAGMPMLPGGAIDSDAAAAWVKRTIDPTQRAAQTRRECRSATIVVPAQPPGVAHLDDPIDGAIVTALPMLAERVPAVAAALARACGASEQVARAIYAAMQTAVGLEVAAVLERLDVPAPHGTCWVDAELCQWAEVNYPVQPGPAVPV
jgi:hypothetical protein